MPSVSVYGVAKSYKRKSKTRKDGITQHYWVGKKRRKNKRWDLSGEGKQLQRAVAVLKEEGWVPQEQFTSVELKGNTKDELYDELYQYIAEEEEWVEDSDVES